MSFCLRGRDGFPACITGHMTMGSLPSGGSASRESLTLGCVHLIGGLHPGVCIGVEVCIRGWVCTHEDLHPRALPIWGIWQRPRRDTWDTTGYGQQARGTHPTGMHSCNSTQLRFSQKEKLQNRQGKHCTEPYRHFLLITILQNRITGQDDI